MYKFSKYNHYGRLDSGDILLYNVFSSSVALLSVEEFERLRNESRPALKTVDLFKTAASQGFVVPSDEDETAKLLALRHSNNFNDRRAAFQILPTTGCNARCFYCYEQDFSPCTMTRETADAVVSFILDYCETMEEVTIAWFGGEPFTCEKTMAYISSKLIPAFDQRGTRYFANVITNAALISQNNIENIVRDYRISSVQITLDGHGEEHLKRKNYIDRNVSYEQIIEAISLLTNKGVQVLVRINADRNNLDSCMEAIRDLALSGADQEFLWPYVAPLYSDKNASHCIPKSELNAVFARAYKTLIDFGFIRSVDGLPMNFANATCCAKMLNNFVIAPNGDISKCEHLLNVEDEVIGNVSTGLRFNAAFARWTSTDIPDKCLECGYLPICQAGCAAAEHRGFGYGRCAHIAFIHDAVITAANYLLKKGGEQHDGLAQEQRSFQ